MDHTRFAKRTAALAMAFGLVAGSALAQDATAGPVWIDFDSGAGGFTVKLPAQPAENTTSTQVEGATISTTTYTLNLGPRGFYFIAYTANPGLKKAKPAETFDSAQKELLKSATLLASKEITLQGFPGRELSLELTAQNPGDIQGTARFFLVNDKLFQMLVTHQKQTAKTEDLKRFLDSFHIAL